MSEQLVPMTPEIQKITEEIEREQSEVYAPGPWTTLEQLRPGAVFVTMEGKRYTKSSNDENGNMLAVSHDDGGFSRFTKGYPEGVCELSVGARPAVSAFGEPLATEEQLLTEELANGTYEPEMLRHLSVLEIYPGDTLVVQFPDELTVGRRRYYEQEYQKRFPDNEILLLDGDKEIGVLRRMVK